MEKNLTSPVSLLLGFEISPQNPPYPPPPTPPAPYKMNAALVANLIHKSLACIFYNYFPSRDTGFQTVISGLAML